VWPSTFISTTTSSSSCRLCGAKGFHEEDMPTSEPCYLTHLIHCHRYLTGGAPEAVFMLAPLLLMLSQDPLLLRQLGEGQRYAPPAAAIVLYLTIAGALQVGLGCARHHGHGCV
jgi:hypothetical protein